MRLRDTGLVQKGPYGFFTMKPFSKVIVNILPSIKFLTENKKYFASHDLSGLPFEFIELLGDCMEGNMGKN